jgi:hypothetical protein
MISLYPSPIPAVRKEGLFRSSKVESGIEFPDSTFFPIHYFFHLTTGHRSKCTCTTLFYVLPVFDVILHNCSFRQRF